jgi:hypothetical protein
MERGHPRPQQALAPDAPVNAGATDRVWAGVPTLHKEFMAEGTGLEPARDHSR